jgi:hypothetical protein
VRISLELPDRLLRRTKSVAASHGVSLGQFVAEALRSKPSRVPAEPPKRPAPAAESKPWMKHLGKLTRFPKEAKLIETRIQDAFEHIDEEQ